jgi:hypothetical protein
MKTKLTTIIFLLITTIFIGQNIDIVVKETDTLNLYSNPLELRSDWNIIDKKISNQIEKSRIDESKGSEIYMIPWRNYSTEWLIENDSLFLTKIRSLYNYEELEIVSEDFILNKENRIYSSWVDSSLIIFVGKCIVCIKTHHNFSSVYPNEKLLEFKNGVLINITHFENKVLKESKFFSYPNTYQDFIYKNINWGKLPDLNNRNFQAWVSIEPTKNGKLKKVDWEDTYIINELNLIDDTANIYLKEAIRITKKIPDWNVVIRHGKILNQVISIVFDEHIMEKYAR